MLGCAVLVCSVVREDFLMCSYDVLRSMCCAWGPSLTLSGAFGNRHLMVGRRARHCIRALVLHSTLGAGQHMMMLLR